MHFKFWKPTKGHNSKSYGPLATIKIQYSPTLSKQGYKINNDYILLNSFQYTRDVRNELLISIWRLQISS